MKIQLYDEKADQWSLGAILYFLITRQHAFMNDNLNGNAVRDRVINGIYDTNNTNWMEISDTGKKKKKRKEICAPRYDSLSLSCSPTQLSNWLRSY